MAKIWVLDTETKGTGANMVPLETVLKKAAPADQRSLRIPRRKAAGEVYEPEAVTRREPYRFRIVDVMTRQVLGDDGGARARIAALQELRHGGDVLLDVVEPAA